MIAGNGDLLPVRRQSRLPCRVARLTSGSDKTRRTFCRILVRLSSGVGQDRLTACPAALSAASSSTRCSAPRVSTESATSTSPRSRCDVVRECSTSTTFAPELGHQREQPGQLARPVGDPDPDGQVAAGGEHAVLDHPHQQHRVDVAAGEHRDHRRLPPPRLGQHGRDRRRAGRLDDLLGALQAEQQRLGDRRLGHRDDLVHHVLDERERQVARAADGDPVGHRGHPVQRDRARRPRARPGTPRPTRPGPRPPARPAASP